MIYYGKLNIFIYDSTHAICTEGYAHVDVADGTLYESHVPSPYSVLINVFTRTDSLILYINRLDTIVALLSKTKAVVS